MHDCHNQSQLCRLLNIVSEPHTSTYVLHKARHLRCAACYDVCRASDLADKIKCAATWHHYCMVHIKRHNLACKPKPRQNINPGPRQNR
jgi:hypothetical protein